jgi:hypothetical protein
MNMIMQLGKTPEKASREDWERVLAGDNSGYSVDVLINFNINLYKDFIKWQKTQKA